jgi:hypothetical protein
VALNWRWLLRVRDFVSAVLQADELETAAQSFVESTDMDCLPSPLQKVARKTPGVKAVLADCYLRVLKCCYGFADTSRRCRLNLSSTFVRFGFRPLQADPVTFVLVPVSSGKAIHPPASAVPALDESDGELELRVFGVTDIFPEVRARVDDSIRGLWGTSRWRRGREDPKSAT